MMPIDKETGVCPLDKTKPEPKKLKKVKYLPHPCHDKWIKYTRKLVVPFTINPYNRSKLSPFTKTWEDLDVSHKVSRIKKHFVQYDSSALEDYFICFEFSNKGRFHCHGMIKIKEGCVINYYHFLETLKKNFGSKKNKKACFKGEPFNSEKDTDFDKCYNYTTKDIDIMYKSLWNIKYITKNHVVKVLQRNDKLKDDIKLLSQLKG